MRPERCSLFGIGVDAVDMKTMVEEADAAIRAQRQCTIFAVNPEKIVAAQHLPSLRGWLNASEWLIPDGVGAVFAARWRGTRVPERVAGSELMPRLCELAATHGHRVFLLGARESSNAAAAAKLQELFPGIVIVDRHDGYFSEADEPALIERINAARVQMLFVALGSPKQEAWIHRNRARLDVNVIQGVGGTFDVLAGVIRRAPRFWIRLNLEWLYRLIEQPSRIKRQWPLFYFAYLVLTGRLSAEPLHSTLSQVEARVS